MSSVVALVPEFPYTFPYTFDVATGMVQVEDYDSAHFLAPAENTHKHIAGMPSLFYQGEPGNFFEVEWMSVLGQQNQSVLMPVYDPRFLHGDIANMPALSLQLSDNEHFGPDGTGDVPEPGSFDITVQPGEFEIRSPL